MAETVTQIQEAPEYLQPGIEKFLEGATRQAGQALDTSKFAPSVVGLGKLQQEAQKLAAKQAGLGTLQFDDDKGFVTGVTGTGVSGFQPFLDTAQTTLEGVSPMIQAAATRTGPDAFKAFEKQRNIGKRMSGSKSRKNDHETKTYGFGSHLGAILASSWGTWEAFRGHFGRLGANLSQHKAILSHLGANLMPPGANIAPT